MLEKVKQQRGLPFLKKGMGVKHTYNNKYGIIIDGNNSGNLDILFDGEQFPSNCHPTWQMTYYDEAGNILAQFKD